MIADEMRERLQALQPTRLEVLDESEQHQGHSGWREGGQTHFRVRIAAPTLGDLSRVERHRLIHRTLGDIVPRIHALAIEASD
ncbi:BolA family transcriptional regulator [Paracoccus aurantiacus]|uniref:BolA family transcriptional regulator n=1 Tax=Paracoccus aurantiacus TaxID=2599412 RepID=A0A5C6S8R8_9RHOB|nr:BolA family protein [Paracoccus aurantiacus]TXB70856.1 BolA family transcriptional regulator [Paracoccus aurantiacus]